VAAGGVPDRVNLDLGCSKENLTRGGMGEHGFFVWEEEESKNGITVKKEVIC